METDHEVLFAGANLGQVFFYCDRVLRITCRKQKEEGCGRHEKKEILKHATTPIAVVCAMTRSNIMNDQRSHKTKKRNRN